MRRLIATAIWAFVLLLELVHRTGSDVAHKVRCYIRLIVAAELVSDVRRFTAAKLHRAQRWSLIKAVGALLVLLPLLSPLAMGATINVVPHPGPGELSLATALELAQPGDEIALAPGSYSGEFTIDKSVQIRGEAGVQVIAAKDYETAFTISCGRVTISGLTLAGKGTGIEVTRTADLTIDRCQFSGLKTGLHLADGRGKITDSKFDSCGRGIVASVRLQVTGCNFTENGVGIAAQYGAIIRINNCTFTANARAVIGETPGRIDGSGNQFAGNGLDLIGDVSPNVRPHETAARMIVEYPSTMYPNLQAAVDAVQSGGKLVITGIFADSAVVDQSIDIVPAADKQLDVSGHPAGEMLLPVFSIIGASKVNISKLRLHGGIAVGSEAQLNLVDVSLRDRPLAITGNSSLGWHGGGGALIATREAKATLTDVVLAGKPALSVEELANVSVSRSRLNASAGENAVTAAGFSQLTVAGSHVVGTVKLSDRAQVKVTDSTINGTNDPHADRLLYAIDLAGPVDLVLNNVEVSDAYVGIYFAANVRLTLAGVTIHGTHVGMGIENRVSEFDFPFGLWTPKIIPKVVVKGSGVMMTNNEVDFAPAATQEPWPVGFYEAVYGDRGPNSITAEAIDSVAHAAKAITSCHLRVHDDYSWMNKVEEIYYVRPNKLRIDIYESDKLVETILSNGHTLWDHDIFGKSATKLDLDSLRSEHPTDWLNILREQTRFDPTFADLYLPSAVYLSTERINGETTYVFSGIPIRGAISDAVRMKIWVSPRDGLWRKVEYYTTKGDAFLTKTMLEREMNVGISNEKFMIEDLPGVKIQDITGELNDEPE